MSWKTLLIDCVCYLLLLGIFYATSILYALIMIELAIAKELVLGSKGVDVWC